MTWIVVWLWVAASSLIWVYWSDKDKHTFNDFIVSIIMPPFIPIFLVIGISIGLLVRFGIMRKPSCFLTR